MNNRAIQNLTQQLQKSLDNNYDVIDMQTVLYVIQQLENTAITKEQLETTRLAKYINELRRRTSSETLARRAKSLLKKWRDIFMPAIQQQSVAPSPTTSSAVSRCDTAPPPVGAFGISQTSKQHQQPIATSTVLTRNSNNNNSKASTGGSANDNNSTKNINIVSNGGFSQQQQSLPMESKLDLIRPRGTQIVSPMMCPTSSNIPIGVERKLDYLAQGAIVQPTSFANVLSTSQSLKPGSASNSSIFSHFRSNSPLPHITPNTLHQRRTRSPASIFDFDSNSSRPQTASTRSKLLVNGENSVAAIGSSSVAVDLHDSNSIALDIVGAPASCVVEEHPSGPNLRKLHSNQSGSLVAADICSISSCHRKSKKHKKEKKRNKLSPDKPPPTSDLAQQLSQPKLANIGPFLNTYGGDMQPTGDEETHNIAATGAVFPHHDSLSSSSMSRFPSNISTNTMTMQHNLRIQTNNEPGSDNMEIREESDLTFAGKFKSSCSAGLVVSDETTLPVVKKSYSDSKDSSDVVIVESRSCSPFTTMAMGVDDSCSSSSRTTIVTEAINLNPDSNHDATIEVKSSIPQRILQPLITQQDPGSISNNTQASNTGGVVVPIVTDQQQQLPVEVVAPVPKKRGRKKGSRGFDAVIAQTHAFLNNSMFERPKLLLGGKKVKTTKELLADIQSRKLGSSATSSPTLNSRQSVSPSTCSEASFQSDLTNTRASMPNHRLSPELLGAISNCRQSDIDDGTSATESNDAATSAKASASSSISQRLVKKVIALSSVDECLNSLMKKLPAIDRAKLEHFDEKNVPCTCIVRETEPVPSVLKQEELIAEANDTANDTDDMKAKNVLADIGKSRSKSQGQIDAPAHVSNGSTLECIATNAQPLKKSPKKPIKSIFDLDYDEENDPLQSFVEAARQRIIEKVGEASTPTYQNDTMDANVIRTNQLTGESELSSAASTSNQGLATENLLTVSISKPAVLQNGEVVENSLVSDANTPALPLYEAVEDPDCPAKHRYDIQTNCITEHHINVLHNCYVPNVNGNWSGTTSFTEKHSKQMQKQCSDSMQDTSIPEANAISRVFSKKVSWWINDVEFHKKVLQRENYTSDDELLFERVVPQYDHIIMDKIIKNLCHVNFTKNYLKKKLKRLNTENERATVQTVAQNEQEIADKSSNKAENRKVKKRKRTRTVSSNNDLLNEDGDTDKKQKHQRRRKHRKIRDTEICTPVDINISSNDVKGVENQIDEMTSNSASCETKTEAPVLSLENSNLNTFSDTENTMTVDFPQQADKLPPSSDRKVLPENSNVEQTIIYNSNLDLNVHHTTNYQLTSIGHSRHGNDLEIPAQDDSFRHNCEVVNKTDEYIREPNAVNTELIESFAYVSDRTSDVINSSDTIKDNQLLPSVVTPTLNEHDGSNSHEYFCNSGESMDQYGNEDVEEEYGDDYFADDHANDEEHEVVTHDMTSSTSTTSQQHIVLTIKKKIPKSASSHVQVDGNNEDMVVSPHDSTVRSGQDCENISIVTSSSTPTTIKIRRKNKQQKRKRQNIGEQMPSPKDHLTNTEMSDINANSNVKNGNPTTLSGDNETTMVEFTSMGLDESQSISNLISMEADDGKVNHSEAEGSIQRISTNCKLPEDSANLPVEQFSPSSLFPNAVHEPEPTSAYGESAINGIEISAENNAQKCDDHDLSDNDGEDNKSNLPKENNGLLESFNELSEENLCGLRVLPKSKTNMNEQGPTSNFLNGTLASVPTNAQDDNYMVQEFKEWHEVLQVPSYNDEILTILPYVVID